MASNKETAVAEETVVVPKKPATRRRTAVAKQLATVDITPVAEIPEIPAAEVPVQAVVAAGKKSKLAKVKKPKLVRDSFTIPAQEYEQLAELKQRCLTAGIAVKKSELLRAGLQALAAMSDAALSTQLETLEKLKTGRPAGTAE